MPFKNEKQRKAAMAKLGLTSKHAAGSMYDWAANAESKKRLRGAINEGTHKSAMDWAQQLFGRTYHKDSRVAAHVDRAIKRMTRDGIDVTGQKFAFHEVERYLRPDMGRRPKKR